MVFQRLGEHLLFGSRWTSSLGDGRSYDGEEADNKCGSDRTVLSSQLRARLTGCIRSALLDNSNMEFLNFRAKIGVLMMDMESEVPTDKST